MKFNALTTLPMLNRALRVVQDELDAHGFLSPEVHAADVYLCIAGVAYGWQYYGSNGDVHIPRLSFLRIWRWWCNYPRASLRDVLRHEYGHVVADKHRGLFRSTEFRDTFDGSHESIEDVDYDPECHVSPYASTCPSEDFAEVFMNYLKFGGKLPVFWRTPAIARRWKFVRRLSQRIAAGQRRWTLVV